MRAFSSTSVHAVFSDLIQIISTLILPTTIGIYDSLKTETKTHTENVVTYTFITYKDPRGKVQTELVTALSEDGSSPATCWDVFAERPSINIKYFIDPDNNDGISEEFIVSAIYAAAEEWDDHTTAELFDDNYEIIHDGHGNVIDNRNVFVFGKYRGSSPTIAVTRFGVTDGTYYEFDILFNEKQPWGDAAIYSNVYDVQGIATHEIGHGAGLLDHYTTECSWATMYGYGTPGLTHQRTLDLGDIVGKQYLYGLDFCTYPFLFFF